MPVSTPHREYSAALEVWQTTKDAVEGQQAIKEGRYRYLPKFVPHDPLRYEQYIKRAYFLGVTGRTHDKFLGAVFRKDLTSDLPAQIEYIEENADGAGQSLQQLSKQVVSEVMQTGRYGLYADYPPAPEGLSAEDVRNLELRASICTYPAENVINWKSENIGGQQKLTLVVLKEMVDVPEDEFTYTKVPQYRVLRLREGMLFTVQLYDQHDEPVSDEFAPRDFSGATWNYIPFHFAGATNNKPNIDKAPLFDMSILNIAHYQTTADHRENLFIHGQLTLGISSPMSAEEFKAANPSGVNVGARAGHFLGDGGSFTTATAPESSSLSKALTDIMDQMVAIGASLVQRGSSAETAEARRIDASSEHSVLDTVVGNVAEAMEAAIEDVSRFMGADPEAVEFDLNREFFTDTLSAQELMAYISLRDAGVIGTTDIRQRMRASGALERSDEEIDGDLAGMGPL